MKTKITDDEIVRKYIQLKTSAVNRNLQFNMSLKHIKRLLTRKTCYYTGVLFSKKVPELKKTIDRIDGSKGYTDDNTVACTQRINIFKSNLTPKEIKQLYNKLKT